MDFKEQLNLLKETAKSKLVKADASAEELEEANKFLSGLDELGASHEKVLSENAKFKDTIVSIVSSQGNGSVPPSEDGVKEPRSMEQIIADRLASQGNK